MTDSRRYFRIPYSECEYVLQSMVWSLINSFYPWCHDSQGTFVGYQCRCWSLSLSPRVMDALLGIVVAGMTYGYHRRRRETRSPLASRSTMRLLRLVVTMVPKWRRPGVALAAKFVVIYSALGMRERVVVRSAIRRRDFCWQMKSSKIDTCKNDQSWRCSSLELWFQATFDSKPRMVRIVSSFVKNLR